ncbi:hypothetical protein GH714_032883 [Hevea brasiliensis]|uniref:Uncharacterized protein n=1 Tax=Hevea brasiliensis TaxID=3981 RepID=A0A6A6LW72_HEVBR|nr:hypothetical protein GH714_032883 [Hevea brasiliensis]
MDSEPIISWLARSSQRVKSSPFRASKKQKISGLSLTSVLPSLTDDGVSRHESLDGGLRNKDISNLSGNSVLPDRFGAGGRIELSPSENPFHPKANKLPVVYYRRRFRNPCSVSRHSFEVNHVSTSLPESDTSHGHVGVASGPLKRLDISLERLDPDAALEKLDTVEALWLTDVTGFLKLNFQLLESRQFRFELSFPVLSICNYSFGKDHTWFFHSLLLLQYGTLVTMWPRVHLQMLFVDNMVGLRFLLFEGCLKQAIAFVFQVLAVFPQPTEHWKFADLQLPVTSIKFKFSCIQDFRKQLVFAFYNFAEVKISKWMDLDSRLKRHCLLTKQLPLSECTYDNIKALQNGTSQLLSSSVCNDSSKN